MSGETPAEQGGQSRRPRPWHTLLLAAYPVLFLYGANVGEVEPGQVWRPLALAVAGACAVLAIAWLGTRDLIRSGLVATIAVVAFFAYGHVANVLDAPSSVWLLAGWILVTVGLVALAVRRGARADAVTRGLNLLGVALVAVALVTAAPGAAAALGDDGPAPRTVTGASQASRDAPDVYYLVLDRYASADTLKRLFGYDNSDFLSFLRARGFFVARDAHANYLKTAQSLASSLNMSYHHEELAREYGPTSDNQLPIFERITDHRVGREFTRRGYEYVHVGSWWEPTRTNPQADLNLGYGGASDFVEVLTDTTILPAARSALGLAASEEGPRRRHYVAGRAELDALAGVADRPGPQFVFAHILLPHDPYVFNRDGEFVPEATERSRMREENYVEQLRYLNARLRVLITELTDRPEDRQPVIVLQSDEGPHPVRYTSGPGYDWRSAPRSDLREKLEILNALRLPGVDTSALSDRISPVNTFRLILNAYFDADLPLLEDHTYVFRGTSYFYDYADVTDRLR
ncbi:MAG: sulfatase-like hydrolase/transferase [Egibacteraceae bacterium]